ncbi:unnamed protein product [Rhizoctonia solani]|uniref:Dynactin subunit 6 n=1 Tax=Rhizoctonia solani TaxID=456999 RepID=A0A8H3GZI9_9AGAM|nr:unnamed protein product [Rhizoctonia solani]
MPAIKDKYAIHSKAVVCLDADLKGDVTIGSGTVVHPKATIFAMAGPIVIDGFFFFFKAEGHYENRRLKSARNWMSR